MQPCETSENTSPCDSRPVKTPPEVEELVVFVRLELYNRSLPCGPKALLRRLTEHYELKNPPSERTIARILAHNGLTHGRTGWYEGDAPSWLPKTGTARKKR